MAQQFVRTARARRQGFVAVLVVLSMALVGCTGRGGGRLAEPLPNAPKGTTYLGPATFAFTFTCDLKGGKAMIRGQLQYIDLAMSTVGGVAFPPISLHGTVDPWFTDYSTCEQAANVFPSTVQFQGTYRPQGKGSTAADVQGRFTVLALDQGRRGPAPADTGDGFSIELFGGVYDGYSRSGYIQGGNIIVTP